MAEPLPDCPWCDAANTLDVLWAEMGTTYCACSCCGKQCRVDKHGAHRTNPPEFDVSGTVIDGP